jgi:outer membrane lipoprotein-sorting protein
MRISPRQPGIDHRLAPRRDRWTLTSGRPLADVLARLMIGLVLSALFSRSAAAAEQKQDEKPDIQSWYTQSYTRSDSGLTTTYLWASKTKFRAETVIRGHNLVTIVKGDTYYVYDALTMTGIAIRRAPEAIAADLPNRRPFGNEAQTLIDQGGEKIREESIAGKQADVYQMTDDSGRRIVWATQDDQQLPIRVELFNRETASTRYKEYVDWVNGLLISDKFFELRPDIQFKRFELDAYIESTLANDPASMIPIIYPELLHGPTIR